MSFGLGDRVVVLANFHDGRGIVEYAATIRRVIAADGKLGGVFAVRYDDKAVNRRYNRQWVAGVDLRHELTDEQVADRALDIAAFTR